MKRAVITGPTGAIGRALINECIKDGYEVLAITHRLSQRSADMEGIPHCTVLRLDESEYGRAIDEMEKQGIDWPVPNAGTGSANKKKEGGLFFHLAWVASFGDQRNNLVLQMGNVQAAMDAVILAGKLGCEAFIGIGSQAEYGRIRECLRPNTPTEPENGYGSAKLCAGQMTRFLCQEQGIRHIWDRVLSVYGPYDRKETLISTAITQMVNNEDTEFSPCRQVWDYLYSEDAARAILLSGEEGLDGKIYVVGSGVGMPLMWYLQRIAEITGYRKEIGFGKRPYNQKQVMHLVADITELKRDTGFMPETSFEDGVRKILTGRLD